MNTSPRAAAAPPGWTISATVVERDLAVRDFEAFYAAHFDTLLAQLCAYTGNWAAAQDAVQEAFSRALPRWSRLSRYDDPAAWVRRVALNLATSRWREIRTQRAWAKRQREEYAPEPGPDRVALATALRRLPPNERRVVIMHYLADLSVAEIAAQCGTPEGTVKARLHRGRTALAAALREDRKEVGHV